MQFYIKIKGYEDMPFTSPFDTYAEAEKYMEEMYYPEGLNREVMFWIETENGERVPPITEIHLQCIRDWLDRCIRREGSPVLRLICEPPYVPIATFYDPYSARQEFQYLEIRLNRFWEPGGKNYFIGVDQYGRQVK